ncbi:group II intron maturase-specific domain-containing protein [Candidatus Endoriftia persephonae]|jgi:RNA-directed DNA polymerase|uniref:group II intron maturase-specific domain-containing protein n=1 Tax=Candidatus Endoriftia persephonae TaxID=393765 RepID=UPI0002FE5D78
MANKLIQRLKVNFKMLFCSSKDRSIRTSIATLTPKRMGWANYFRHTGVKGVFEKLDG